MHDMKEGRDWRRIGVLQAHIEFINPVVRELAGRMSPVKDGDEWVCDGKRYQNPEEAVDAAVDAAYEHVQSQIRELTRKTQLLNRRSQTDISLELLEQHLDSMTDEERLSLQEFLRDDTPRGWIELRDGGPVPMLLAIDVAHGCSPYMVRNADGEESWEFVGDGNIWYYDAVQRGVTHWYNPGEDEFDSHRAKFGLWSANK